MSKKINDLFIKYPNLKRQIISYVSTFLAFFLPIISKDGQELLLAIYNDGWTWAIATAFGAVLWRSVIKAVTQATFCKLFPSLFKKL